MWGLLELVSQVVTRRAAWMAGARVAPGMLDALVAAELARPDAGPTLEAHYLLAMPALRAQQLEGRSGIEQKVFGTPLVLRQMPRLSQALDALFGLVADAGLSCAACLGAPAPRDLVEGRTLGEVYEECHFGGFMPMLYAYPADLADALERAPLAFIDERLVGPLVHELSHFHAEEPPAPANIHEALAAWIGSEAWPAQVWPARDEHDAIPGAAWFAAVGGFVARMLGEREVLRLQAGALDPRDAFGPACAEALRLYGFLPFLETGAPHLLSDAFHPARWWKLLDLHRDAGLARDFHERLVEPLLSGSPARQVAWDDALDALSWRDLPAWRDAPGAVDRKLATLAERALCVRAERHGSTFCVVRADPADAAVLDVDACELRAAWPGPDAIGAPVAFPWPPALCAEAQR
jgi:hypothetical protein